MIKAERTIINGRINLVDTSFPLIDEKHHFVRQISEEEAIFLVKSLLETLLTVGVKSKSSKNGGIAK